MDCSFDLIVLGAGSGGLAAAKRAASYGARVAIVEGDRVGGTCVIRGCVPKKLLVYGSQYGECIHRAKGFGYEIHGVQVDVAQLLDNVRQEVDRLNQLHVSFLEKAGVKLFKGWGYLKSTNSIGFREESGLDRNTEIFAKKILISVGGRPFRPTIIGSDLSWVSDDIFIQKNLPQKIVVVGGGFIACEFASIFRGLGLDVIQLVRSKRLLKGFDKELSLSLADHMINIGIDLCFNHSILSLEGQKGSIEVITKSLKRIACGGVLFATGRTPFVENLNLNEIGIKLDGNCIKVDEHSSTNISNIFAIGDVTNRVNLTPVAIEEGRVFADRFFGNKSRKIDYDLVPKAVFTQPEISSVGLTEEEAKEKYGNDRIIIYKSKFRPMSQSFSKRSSKCILKLVVEKSTERILGCHMFGENAAEIIQMASIAISMKATKNNFDQTMALHPTIAEEFVTMR